MANKMYGLADGIFPTRDVRCIVSIYALAIGTLNYFRLLWAGTVIVYSKRREGIQCMENWDYWEILMEKFLTSNKNQIY